MQSIILVGLLVGLVILLIKYLKVAFKGISGRNILINGGSGSGKTTLLTYLARKQYLKNYRKVWLYNHIFYYFEYCICWIKWLFIKIFKDKKLLFKDYSSSLEKQLYPLLFSNYPIWINKKLGYSCVLDFDIFTLKNLIPQKSVIAISECQNIFNQYFYKNEYLSNLCLKFFSQHRHYYDSYVFVDSQSLDNLSNIITRTSSLVINAQGITKLGFLSFIKLYPFYSGSFDDKLVNSDFKVCLFPTKIFNYFYSRFNRYYVNQYMDSESFLFSGVLFKRYNFPYVVFDDKYEYPSVAVK